MAPDRTRVARTTLAGAARVVKRVSDRPEKARDGRQVLREDVACRRIEGSRLLRDLDARSVRRKLANHDVRGASADHRSADMNRQNDVSGLLFRFNVRE